MLTLDREIEIKAHDDGTFTGILSVFGDIDFANDIVVEGAFTKSLEAHQSKGRMPALLWQHDTREPIGVWRKMQETSRGLEVEGELFINEIPRAKQAHKLMKEGGLSGLSIGFRTMDAEYKDDGTRILKEIDLFEGSLVTFPCLDSARISSVKSILENGSTPSLKEFEAFLRDAGFSRKQSKAIVSLGYKAINPRDVDLSTQDSLDKLFKTITS